MRIYTSVACLFFLLGPLSPPKVWATSDPDLYLDDYGSGDGSEVVGGDPAFTTHYGDRGGDDGGGGGHHHHLTYDDDEVEEGSGHRHTSTGAGRGPYGAVYDDMDGEEDVFGDDDDYNDDVVGGRGGGGGGATHDDEEDYHEGSGTGAGAKGGSSGTYFVDGDEEEVTEERTRPDLEVIRTAVEEEEISVHSQPTVEARPATNPPPTQTGTNMNSPIQIHSTKTEERQVSIFAQPGILAAFIGGAVVGLLCAILLVMFIVYRMRKKDEGSYPLDEPKRMPLTSSYSPNDKEIYA